MEAQMSWTGFTLDPRDLSSLEWVVELRQKPCQECGGQGADLTSVDVRTFENPDPNELFFKVDCFYCAGSGWEDVQDVEVAI